MPLLIKSCMLFVWVVSSLILFSPVSSEAGKKKDFIIAVAPFKNIMKRADLEWMGEGIADSITTRLNHVEGLQIVERVHLTEIINEMKLTMAGITEGDATAIGKLASADYLVVGSFQKLDIGSKSNLKINVRVVNAKTGVVEKGKAVSSDGPYEEIFEMQGLVATKLAGSMGCKVSKAELEKMKKDETASVVAYELYHLAKMESDDLRREKLLKRAIEIDPQYAKAHLLLGSYYRSRAPVDESFDAPSVHHLEKALTLDPGLTEAHFALGDFYFQKQKMHEKNSDEQAGSAREKAIFHLEKFIEHKKNSQSKYFIWKVKKAESKLGKLKS
ncbi:MAG: hypothetical protein C4522_15755 [Desulfobacteraceae bacterium]|nr:MAG: hypothetical protein C4522_15755 [Desulfobacteraceae bacterium]